MIMAFSDTELVFAAAGGNDAAFTTLYERYATRVLGSLTRIMGNGSEREDVLQQVFLRLHHALPSFRGESKVSTFIGAVAHNVAVDHLRRQKRLPVGDGETLAEFVDRGPSPEELAIKREEMHRLFLLLERLKPAKRAAFVFVAINGMSLYEASELLHAKPAAIKQRVLSARRDLLAMMERDERR
jgi:RNA polymerase sigma-70 factor, ECF subfamily